MNKFLKENWFKLVVSLALVIISGVILFSYALKPYYKEKKKQACVSSVYENSNANGVVIKYEDLKSINSYCESGFDELDYKFKEKQSCSFELNDIKEYKGKYGNDKYSDSYVVYEGLIKNTSSRSQNLKAMIAKIYTGDKVFIADGYTEYAKDIEPNESIPFKVHVLVPTAHETEIRKYFSDRDISKDIYPWFNTCK